MLHLLQACVLPYHRSFQITAMQQHARDKTYKSRSLQIHGIRKEREYEYIFKKDK